MGKIELVDLLYLSSWCLVMVERLFLAVPWGCLRFVIVVFPDHTHLLFLQLFSPRNSKLILSLWKVDLISRRLDTFDEQPSSRICTDKGVIPAELFSLTLYENCMPYVKSAHDRRNLFKTIVFCTKFHF